ncbi:MAG TPA: ABC transporter permease [Longimicrobiales bacterium]|nr:ABC transporter permease [Longimicrobiales bacterium]
MSRRRPSGIRPPAWAERLICALLPPGLSRDAILGDLEEELVRGSADVGPVRARRRYARQALSVVLHYLLFRAIRDVRRSAPRTGDPSMLRASVDDLAQGFRSLAHAPQFAILAVLTLAAGVGSTTAIFSVVDAVLLRPLPYPSPDELVVLRYERDGQQMVNHSEPEFLDYEREVRSFSAVAAWTSSSLTLGTQGGEPERIASLRASAALLDLLGVEPMLGRAFTREEDTPEGDRVVVLSHGLWVRSFGGDAGVIGRTVVLEDVPHTVIGVMPQAFSYPEPGVQAYTPLRLNRAEPWERNNHYLAVTARLAPGVALAAAAAELEGLGARSTEAYPEFYATSATFRAHKLRDVMVGDVRTALLVLLGAVAGVLLIASVNAAALFLARGEGRRSEIAVRTALGAGRGRVAAQLLAESLLVALAAAAAGTALAHGGVTLLRVLAPADLPRLDEIAVNGRVLGFGVVVALATGLLFGLAPALQALRSDVRDVLASGARGGLGTRRSGRFRRALVVVQLSLATTLALGAGLLLRSFQALREVELGFDPRGVLAVPLAPSAAVVAADTEAVAFYEALEERVAALPGVTAVGSALRVPLIGGHDNLSMVVEGRGAPSIGDAPAPGINWVTPGFFEAMGIRLVEGRVLTDADRAGAPPVGLVNERLAAELWPGESAVGKRLRRYGEGHRWIEIVGVVADVKHYGIREEASTKFYAAHAQGYEAAWYSPSRMTLLVRTGGDPLALAPVVRAAVREVGPAVPIGEVRPLDDVVAQALSGERFTFMLIGAFALVALLLAAVGVYGVIAQTVAARTREIGLRMAVGAGRGAIARSVMREGAVLTAIGGSLGLAAGLLLARFMRSLLFGISELDPWTYAVAVPVLALSALAACVAPALHAARLDPVRALRSD